MTNCEAIKVRFATSECERPQSDEPGHHYEFLEYRPGTHTNAFVWALVADKAPASSPTDAEIARRVDLLTVASTLDAHPADCPEFSAHYAHWVDGPFLLQRVDVTTVFWRIVSEAEYLAEVRRVAIRQLLAERGGK
jgi:hypothetical protein